MNDAHDPYEPKTNAMGENIQLENAETESNGRINQETPPDIAATMRSLRVEFESCREDNERMIKAHEEQNQLNASMLQSLTDIQRQINAGHQTTNPEGSRSSTRRNSCKRSNSSRRASRDRTYTPEISSSGSSNCEESIGGSISSSHRGLKRHYKNNSYGEFKKVKPPTFDGEVKSGQEFEA